jgi:hypothetical protein
MGLVFSTNSFVIAATEHLHRRIARMGERIRQLEDALALLQASTSKEPHPLLCENAIIVDNENLDDKLHESEDEGAVEVSRALGTLSVTDHGLARFFGSTGGSDLLLVCCTIEGPYLSLLKHWIFAPARQRRFDGVP